MDLDAQIARVAVLRTEARTADHKSKAAAKEAAEANDKFREADSALYEEIRSRVDALDPRTELRDS